MSAPPHPPSGVSRNPGSQSALRERNQQRIVDRLLGSGPLTQAELARQTGLSTATISNIVTKMTGSGVVETEQTTSRGRRALLVRLTNNGTVAVGVDFGRRHLRVVVATVGYVVVAEEFVELPIGFSADTGIGIAATVVSHLLEAVGLLPTSVLGIGIGVPGPIDQRTGTVLTGAILPEWVGIRLPELEARFRSPVSFDNDANLGALAEVSWGPHGAVRDLVFIKVGSGIGAGLILGGKPFYGHLGVTGEIGHEMILDTGERCHCGNRGCLETVASTSAMMSALARNGRPVSTADIVRNAAMGDATTLAVIADAGVAIGRALATASNLINPEIIVVGGPLTALGDLLLDPIRQSLERHAIPSIGAATAVVMSSLGERAEALGAAALILHRSTTTPI